MSLLNQMLNDLDRRRAEASGAPALHREVRPLPPPPAGWPRAGWLLAALLVGLLVVGGGWLLAGPGGNQAPVATAAAIPAAVALPALAADAPGPSSASIPANAPSQPNLPTPPAGAPASTPAAATAPPPAAPTSREARPLAVPPSGASLRLSDSLSGAAGTASAAPAVPAPADGQIDKRLLDPDLREQAERLYRSAQNLLAQGREQDAATTLRAALRDVPDHLAARQLLIKLGIDRRAFAQAELDLEEGLRRLPRQTAWAMLLARLQVERGDAAGGLAVLERHEPYANGAADYQAAMATLLQRLNRPAEAAARFGRATAAEPGNGRWWLGLALAREAQGEAAAAREAFRTALAAGNLSEDLRAFAEARLR